MFPIAIAITLIGLWILSACKTTKPAKPASDLQATLKSERKMSLTDAVGETIEMGIRVNDNPEINGDNSISKLHGNTSYKNESNNNTVGRKSHLSDVNYQKPPPLVIPSTSSRSLKSPMKKSLSSRTPTKPNSTMNNNNNKSSTNLNKTPETIKPKTSEEELITPINIDIPPPDQM